MEFRAEKKYLRVSPQKARLVLNLIKGRRVEDARNTLLYTKKRVAAHVGKLLQSALDNANFLSAEKNLDVEIDNLYVKSAIANDGPRMKRIRPAPQGRAFRYQRRISHIELVLAERGKDGTGPVVHAPSGDTAPGAKVKRRAPVAKKASSASKGAAKNAKKKKAAAK
jgi:large subunit ribosomal protein L22